MSELGVLGGAFDALMLFILIWIIIFVIFLFWVVTEMAAQRGRSVMGWFLLTLFIISPFFAILLLYFLGDTDEMRRKKLLDDQRYLKNYLTG